MSTPDNLSPVEIETVRRALAHQNADLTVFDKKMIVTLEDAKAAGCVREAYNREEMKAANIGIGSVTCFDAIAQAASDLLPVDTPFGSGIKKYQLPFDMMPIRIMQTIFPPATEVSTHVHPPASEDSPGGGFRVVTKGSITYKDKVFKAGDWFYIANGEPYSFVTDAKVPTEVMYTYAFFGFVEGNRLSHPHAV